MYKLLYNILYMIVYILSLTLYTNYAKICMLVVEHQKK